jgi:peptidoglycan/xylan/chitin deacetylase (PgdA/CDA1 family)
VLRRATLALFEQRLMDRLCRVVSQRGAILAYHGIVSAPHPSRSGLHLTLDGLASHLDLLGDRGYHVIPLMEFLERLAASRTVAACVALTFDDAYCGCLDAIPLLQARATPATLFVPTGFIGTERRQWWDALDWYSAVSGRGALFRILAEFGGSVAGVLDPYWGLRTLALASPTGYPPSELVTALERLAREGLHDEAFRPMTWDEVARWASWEGGDLAPHTISHPVLPLTSPDSQTEEARKSHEELRARFPRTVAVFAYPYGLYSAGTVKAVRTAGFRFAVTMDRVGAGAGWKDLLRVPRIPIDTRTRLARLGLLTTGPIAWYRQREMKDGYPALPGDP